MINVKLLVRCTIYVFSKKIVEHSSCIELLDLIVQCFIEKNFVKNHYPIYTINVYPISCSVFDCSNFLSK